MASDGNADLAAQTGEFSLDDVPAFASEQQADTRLEAVTDLSYLDDFATDPATTEPEAPQQDPETVVEDTPLTEDIDLPLPESDDDAALMGRVQAHRLVKGDLERLSLLLQGKQTLERTGPDNRQLEQQIAELQRQIAGQQPAAAPPGPAGDPVTVFTQQFEAQHGREPTGPEIVTHLAEEAGRQAAERRFGELQTISSLEMQYNALVVEYPWAADRSDLIQEAAELAGALAMKPGRGPKPDDLRRAFRGVASDEIDKRSTQRTDASRQVQAQRAAATPAVPVAAEPGEPAPPALNSFEEIRQHNLRHFGEKK